MLEKTSQSDLNPYLAGFGVGLVLIAAFILVGRGLSMIGAVSAWASSGILAVSSQSAGHSPFLTEQAAGPKPWLNWFVYVIIGVLLGSLGSALLRRKVKVHIERGPRCGSGRRLIGALLGGVLMGLGAKIGGGCTSGQILSGGALLSVGSWVFMGAVFAAAYAGAWFFRRQWV